MVMGVSVLLLVQCGWGEAPDNDKSPQRLDSFITLWYKGFQTGTSEVCAAIEKKLEGVTESNSGVGYVCPLQKPSPQFGAECCTSLPIAPAAWCR